MGRSTGARSYEEEEQQEDEQERHEGERMVRRASGRGYEEEEEGPRVLAPPHWLPAREAPRRSSGCTNQGAPTSANGSASLISARVNI